MKSTLARKPSEVYSSLEIFCEELKKQGFAIQSTPSAQLTKNWLALENPLPSVFDKPSLMDFCYHSKKLAPAEGWGMVMRDSKSCAEPAVNELILDYPEAAMDFLIRKLAHSEWVGDEKNYVNEYVNKYRLRAEAGVVVGPHGEFGENVILEAGARIGARVKIGKNTRIGAGSRIADDTVIGDNCYFRGPVSIGGHGFGFTVYPGAPVARHRLHVGSVMIADGVQLGSFVCVDRGVFEDTVIGARSATDNLVQIAHNVKIGKHAVLCGFVSLSGSTILGDYVTFGGLVVSKGHLTVGNRVSIGAFSAIYTDVPDDSQLRGVPVRPIKRDLRIMAIQDKLPEIYSQLKGLLKENVK